MSLKWALGLFSAGVIVGALAHFHYSEGQPLKVVRCEEVPKAEAIVAPAAPTPRPLQARLVAKPDGHLSELAPVEPQSIVTLSLDEPLIKELEDSIDRLRDSIYTESTEQGWRVRVLHQDDLVARAGLHDGDVVSYDGLNSQYVRDGRGYLAERVAAVFNSIRR